jgi:hypothetical protein
LVVGRGPSGPPDPPRGLRALATTCAPPMCQEIQSTVSLSWTPPSDGSPVTGYRVLRDGADLGARLGPAARTYEDRTVALGTAYRYSVVAGSEAGSSESSAVRARAPLPPPAAARLAGPFKVRITVVSASNLSEVEGIEDPRPGDSKVERWTFTPTCQANTGPCPVNWFTTSPALRPRGLKYRGTVRSAKARCIGAASVARPPVYASFNLRVEKARADVGAWQVSAFRGTYVISFTCPGGAASRSEFEVKAVGS